MSNNVKTLEDIAKLPPGVTEVEAEGIGDAELVALSSKTSITDLTLWCDENVTDKGIQCLVRLPRLEKLIIHSASLMTDKGLASLGCLTNLKELWLGSLPLISDDVLGRTLQNLKKLSYLDLSYIGHRMHVYMQALEQRQNPDDIVPPPPERTGREYLKALLSLPDLREIKLEENELVDADLEVIGRLTNLKGLSIEFNPNVTDDGIGSLEGLIYLEQLNIEYCTNLSDRAMLSINKLTNLHSLLFAGCDKMTDAALGNLSGLTKLQWARINQESFSAKAIERFGKSIELDAY